MKKKIITKSNKALQIIVWLLVALTMSSLIVSAQNIPNDSYNYWEDYPGGQRKPVYSGAVYETKLLVDANYLGISGFTKLTDVCADTEGNLYVLDGDASKIYILNRDYKLVKSIDNITYEGNHLSFTGAKGVFVSKQSHIYISDTENARVLETDLNGLLVNMYTLPDSELIPENYQFRPIKSVVDSKNCLYVLSEGSYYGALLYSENKEFLGFYGANNTETGIVTALKNIWNTLFMTNEKLAASMSSLPYQFTDLVIDSDNFIYTTTGKTGIVETQKAKIRRFSPGGILSDKNEDKEFADISYVTIKGNNEAQDLLSIAIDDDGFIYSLDSTFGRVYLYDSDFNLLGIFGGGFKNGNQKGTFILPCSIETYGDDVIVCDGEGGFLTVFKATDYGKTVKKASLLTLGGKYAESESVWKEVLSYDLNSQVAYRGLAKAAYEAGDYSKALEYSRTGYDKQTYANAYRWIRRDFLADNFIWIFPLTVIAVLAFILFLIYITKHKVVLIKNNSVRIMFSSVSHPFDTFGKIGYERNGSVLLCIILVGIFYISTVSKNIFGGFCFVNYNPSSFNSLIVLLRTVGLVLLYSITNWAVCTLMGGKGRIKEIITVTCYSLIPLIFGDILFILVSNTLIPSEAGFLNIITSITYIYAGMMLCVGNMKIHDYSLGKFIGTTIITVIGMGIVVFLGSAIMLLIQQLGAFILSVINELVYR